MMENTTAVMKTANEAIRNKTSVAATYSISTPANSKSSGSGLRAHHSTPLVSRVYHARMVGMHKCIQSAIASIKLGLGVTEEGYQLLVLGCGHDTSYSTHSSCRTFLVDFEEIIHARRDVSEGVERGGVCVGGDLREPADLLRRLREETLFNPLLPTVSESPTQSLIHPSPVCLFVCLSVCLSVLLSVCLSVCLSVYLSICLFCSVLSCLCSEGKIP
jgi:hypothetical protein